MKMSFDSVNMVTVPVDSLETPLVWELYACLEAEAEADAIAVLPFDHKFAHELVISTPCAPIVVELCRMAVLPAE